jgi:hypothetical protein
MHRWILFPVVSRNTSAPPISTLWLHYLSQRRDHMNTAWHPQKFHAPMKPDRLEHHGLIMSHPNSIVVATCRTVVPVSDCPNRSSPYSIHMMSLHQYQWVPKKNPGHAIGSAENVVSVMSTCATMVDSSVAGWCMPKSGYVHGWKCRPVLANIPEVLL